MTTASAVVSFLVASAAIASMASVTSAAASARVYELAVETFCKLLFGSLAYSKDLTCEMESLACHLMVEVHLYRIFSHFKHYTRNYCAHAVEHRNGVARYEKVFAHFSVYLEC